MVATFVRVAAKSLALALGAAMIVVLGSSCHKSSTPEAEVRALVEKAQHAAEARKAGELKDLLSVDFRDAQGNTPAEILQYLRGYFVLNQSVRLVTRIDSLEFPASDTANLTVGVASATQANGESGLSGLGANFRTFELVLVREGSDWKVRYAKWQ
jgi:hypothetical protein